MTTELYSFLNKPANTHAREAILMYRLFLDVKVAAGQCGYYLNTYFDDVDHDGFDVIFDDQDCIKKTQVKSVGADNGTNSWGIHKRILRPSVHMIDRLGFEPSPRGEGTDGGVILIEFQDTAGALDTVYYYTDLFVLLAFQHGLMCRKHLSSHQAVDACLNDWLEGLGKEQLSVPRAAFLKAKNADALLALMGLHSSSSCTWKHTVVLLVNHIAGDRSMQLPAPIDSLKHEFWRELGELVDEPKLAGPT